MSDVEEKDKDELPTEMVGHVDTKLALLKALEDKLGIVTDAVRLVGAARSTFYEWLKNDPVFKARVEEIQDVALDFVEGKLFEKINGVQVRKGTNDETGKDIVYDLPPSDVAITFYLKTKGKRRGYIERQEVTGADGASLNASIVVNPIQTVGAPPIEETEPGNEVK